MRSPWASDADATLHVDLAGFAGPIDRLVELARQHRVDLGPLSVVALADQVAAALEAAGQTVCLDRQGEWLVATTWLVWLKSRLLLPRHSVEARQVQDAVAAAAQHIELQAATQAAAAWLDRRPQLGRDVFARGVPPPKTRRAGFVALLEAGLVVFRGAQGRPEEAVYRPDPPRLWRVADVLARVRAVLAAAPAGGELTMFLPRLDPGGAERPLRAKAAVASTFLAGLELARTGTVALRQEAAFASITMQAANAVTVSGHDGGCGGWGFAREACCRSCGSRVPAFCSGRASSRDLGNRHRGGSSRCKASMLIVCNSPGLFVGGALTGHG